MPPDPATPKSPPAGAPKARPQGEPPTAAPSPAVEVPTHVDAPKGQKPPEAELSKGPVGAKEGEPASGAGPSPGMAVPSKGAADSPGQPDMSNKGGGPSTALGGKPSNSPSKDAPPTSTPSAAGAAFQGGAAPSKGSPGVRAFAPVLERLLMQGVSPEIARALVAEAVKVTPPSERRRPGDAYRAVAEVLRQRIPVSGPLRVRRDRASIVGVVGPTGVGKSTTLAKLAAIAALKDHKTVALITTDTYRIAATEQLKIYGRLLSLPVTVARGRGELEKAIERYKSRDLILLDTAGHSPRDLPKLQDLGSMLGKESPRLESTPVVRLLVISATTKSADVQNILTQFGAVGFDGLIFTKIDESKTHGALLNAAVWSRRPLTYFALGQAVPQDIEVATPERLVSLLLPLDQAPEE